MPEWLASPKMWGDIFVVGVPIAGKIVRPALVSVFLEGDPALLVEHGCVKNDALAKELLTTAELMTVLHRQGFETVEEVERCILQPGGTFDVKGIDPPLEQQAHAEVMRALTDLSGKLDALAQARGRA